MTVQYTKEQHKYAKEHGLQLCTLDVPGMTFQGPSSEEEVTLIVQCMQQIFELRRTRFNEEYKADEEASQQ